MGEEMVYKAESNQKIVIQRKKLQENSEKEADNKQEKAMKITKAAAKAETEEMQQEISKKEAVTKQVKVSNALAAAAKKEKNEREEQQLKSAMKEASTKKEVADK